MPGTSESTSCSQTGSISTTHDGPNTPSARTDRHESHACHHRNSPRADLCQGHRRAGTSHGRGAGRDDRCSQRRSSRRRTWVERVGSVPASTPMWLSRASWTDALRAWATPDVIGSVCRRLGCSITAATLVAVATAMAEYADHATGRNVAVARKRIAAAVGCDVRTVTTAWKVLRETRWAVEASRGHGSARTPGFGNRPSVWHLTPRQSNTTSPSVGEDFHLPTSGGFRSLTPVGSHSPSTRKRVRETKISSKTRSARARRRQSAARAPRPLALQRLVAELVRSRRPYGPRLRGLGHQHLGGLCDAITAAGLDVSAWSADDLKKALDQDMVQSGTSWPDHITNPAGFLRSRLRRLPIRPAGATQRVPAEHDCDVQDPRRTPTESLHAASAAPAHLSRTAIANCALCDDDGYRGVNVCDHIQRQAVHAAGMRAIYQVLKRPVRHTDRG